MEVRRLALAFGLVALAACSATIPAINARPAQYYQKKIAFTGQIDRSQSLTGETLLEVADAQAHRILVRTADPHDAVVGDWVKVQGILLPEARVGGRTIPDVVMADTIDKVRAPWLRDLF